MLGCLTVPSPSASSWRRTSSISWKKLRIMDPELKDLDEYLTQEAIRWWTGYLKTFKNNDDWDSDLFWTFAWTLGKLMFEVSSVIKREPLNSQPKNAKSSDFKRFIYVRRSKHHVSTDLNRNYFKRKTIAFLKHPYNDSTRNLTCKREKKTTTTTNRRLETGVNLGNWPKTPTRPFWDINIYELGFVGFGWF